MRGAAGFRGLLTEERERLSEGFKEGVDFFGLFGFTIAVLRGMIYSFRWNTRVLDGDGFAALLERHQDLAPSRFLILIDVLCSDAKEHQGRYFPADSVGVGFDVYTLLVRELVGHKESLCV